MPVSCPFQGCIALLRIVEWRYIKYHAFAFFCLPWDGKTCSKAASVTGRLHGTIVGPTGRTDRSVRLVGPTIVSCKRFIRPVGQTVGRIKHVWFRPTADPTVEACGHYVRLVGPTGQSDDQSRCIIGGTCCLRHSYIAAAVKYTSGG